MPVSASSSKGPPIRMSRARAHELVDERVVDRLLDDEPRPGRADLARMQEDRGQGVVESGLDVGVGEDDVGVLAAELEGHLLDRGCGRGHHDPAGGQAAGERDEVDVRVLAQRGAGLRPGAEDEIADTVGKSGLLQVVHEQDGRARGELAGLDDEGVARGECRGHLPGRLQERVVPRRDQPAHPDRLVDDARDEPGIPRLDQPTGQPLGDAGEVAEAADHVGDVVAGLDDPLAGVEGLGAGDRLDLPFEDVGKPVQERRPLHGGSAGPGARVEGTAGRVDRRDRVAAARLVHDGHDGAVGRTPDLARAARRRRNPAPID